MIDFDRFPSPCYIMDEELLRKNLTLIKSVADRSGVEIILAFKHLLCGAHFLFLGNISSILRRVPYMKRDWHWKSSAVKLILTLLLIRRLISRKSCV